MCEYVQYIHELCTRLTNAYMLRIDGFRQEADNDAQHGHDDEQDDTEMQVVNFADDVRLVGVLAARCLQATRSTISRCVSFYTPCATVRDKLVESITKTTLFTCP